MTNNDNFCVNKQINIHSFLVTNGEYIVKERKAPKRMSVSNNSTIPRCNFLIQTKSLGFMQQFDRISCVGGRQFLCCTLVGAYTYHLADDLSLFVILQLTFQ